MNLKPLSQATGTSVKPETCSKHLAAWPDHHMNQQRCLLCRTPLIEGPEFLEPGAWFSVSGGKITLQVKNLPECKG